MASHPKKPITPEQCRRKAAECLEMATRTQAQAHKIMLKHMAETWERIAKEVSNAGRKN